MAKTLKSTTTASMTIIISFFFFFSTLVSANIHTNTPSFSKTLTDPKKLGLHRNHQQERLCHLHFYFHDSVNGKNPTTVRVAKAATSDKSRTAFGLVSVMDDPLTLQPDRASERVGSAQGIYAYASQSEVGLLMVLSFVFTEGKYNGSALSILGRNAIFEAAREMPVVGGSGLFRFARGYALARTYSFNTTSLDAVVEYDVYVFH